ncbi:MAG: hypothetical protein WC438_00400 [Candidatus Pacearchaeota archaeon]
MEKFTVDLSGISRHIDGFEKEYEQILKGQLLKHGFYNKNCLYSVFDDFFTKKLEETGTYRFNKSGEAKKGIFAFKKQDLIWAPDENTNIWFYIESQLNPGIAIYDKRQFNNEDDDPRSPYIFKNPNKKLDALLGIASIKFVD